MKTGVIKINEAFHSGYRIDPSLHLSEGVKVRSELTHLPYELTTVANCSSSIFLGNIFSRCFVSKPEFGVTYLAASDTVLANIETGRYLSKKQASTLNYLMLDKDWILVTCSGTLGNVTYTNKSFCNKIATHDLIRIIPDDTKYKKGCLYAFLSSKFGYYQITQSQFGGVVKHINDKQAGAILVPKFPDEFQKEVDHLIQESARLREEAAEAIKKAHDIIEDKFDVASGKKTSRVSVQSIISSHNKRLEALYHTSENRSIYDYIVNNCQHVLLGDESVSRLIFKPNIFKRQYVDKNGYQLIGGADMLKRIPSTDKMISKRQVDNMSSLKLNRNYILVTRAGTIGNVAFVDEQLKNFIVSEDVLRVVPKDDKVAYYLYAFLSSKIGYKLISLFTYGSVIQHIEAQHLELVPIPLLNKDLMEQIENLVSSFVAKIELSKQKEIAAINMVEAEIEKWNN